MNTENYKNLSTLNNREILILGGSGSLGSTLTKILLKNHYPHGVRIFSRGEFLQWKLKNELKSLNLDKNIAFLIGDVREYQRLWRAMQRVDIVINAVALKQIGACENNPIEAVKTNINGAENIINAALDAKVEKVMHVSTDKACSPCNLYGATKMSAEKLFISANIYSGGRNPKFSCCRYGNVLGSRGSVIPLFREQAKTGKLTLTHKDMCRFWITLEEVAKFLLSCIEKMRGKEIFIPKMKIAKIIDIAEIIAPNTEIEEIGIQSGEKIYETLITREESRHTKEYDNFYIIKPSYKSNKEFEYTSDPENNPSYDLLKGKELEEKIKEIE